MKVAGLEVLRAGVGELEKRPAPPV
jgi:hypothetical protein